MLAQSGRFRLDVLPVRPRSASEDWTFRVVDVETGGVVLLPRQPGFDGGIGVVIAGEPDEPDTVWVVDGNQVRRRRHDRATGRWSERTPASSEPLPAVVQANIRARTTAD